MNDIPKEVNWSDLRDYAADLARGAAQLVREQRAELVSKGELASTAQLKSSAVDPVTAVDKASEEYLVGRLTSERPEDGIRGEEGASKSSQSGLEWIIDPIDGTVNFLYNLPVYAVSVGAVYHGEPVAGAVLNVATGELYQAAKNQGATVTRDGVSAPLRASGVTHLESTLVATGFAYTAQRRKAQGEIVARLLPQVRDIRRMGAAALDLCRVAEGSVDAYYEHGIHPWDYAAGAIIATEAGAVLTHPGLDVSGAEGVPVVCTAPGIAKSFRTVLKECGGGEKLPG